MNFTETFKNCCILMGLKADTKQGVIEEMVDQLLNSGKIKEKQSILNAILCREAKMSTGMQYGVAIPHGKTDSVETLVTAFGLKQTGIDFGALDGKPSTIFIMTISPINTTGPHTRFLAEIGRILNSANTRKRILESKTENEVRSILTAIQKQK